MKLKLLISTFCIIAFFCTTTYADEILHPALLESNNKPFVIYNKRYQKMMFSITTYPDNISRDTAFLCIDLETGKLCPITWLIFLKGSLYRTVVNRATFKTTDYTSLKITKNDYIYLQLPFTSVGHFYEIIATPILQQK